jgi:hypothetical protein
LNKSPAAARHESASLPVRLMQRKALSKFRQGEMGLRGSDFYVFYVDLVFLYCPGIKKRKY